MKLPLHLMLTLLVLLCQETNAQTPNSLLWKIEAPHLIKPSFLYGTMHSRDRRAHEYGDSVLVKLKECDALALEILTSDMTDDPFALMGLIMMQDTTLEMLLSDEDYQLVKEKAEEQLGMYALFVDKLMPVFTSSLFTETGMNQDKSYTVDEFLEKSAMKEGLKTIGIETVDEQLTALKAISLYDQAKILMDQIHSMHDEDQVLDKLMDYYRLQNLDGMLEVYQNEEIPEMFDKALVVKRNHVMAQRIDSLISMQPTFNAVGALHLVGEEGILKLLSAKGYTVSPVMSSFSGAQNQEIHLPEKWISFTSKQGKFSALFPENPDETNQNAETVYGDAVFYIAMYEDKLQEIAFTSTYTIVSKAQLKAEGKNFYTLSSNRISELNGWELISRNEFKHQNMPAVDCLYRVDEWTHVRYQIILSKNNLYLFGVSGSPEFVLSEPANKFYQSIKLN